MSLDSRYVLLVPEDRQLLERLSNPGTKTSVRSAFDWNGAVSSPVKVFYRRSRLAVLSSRALETK